MTRNADLDYTLEEEVVFASTSAEKNRLTSAWFDRQDYSGKPIEEIIGYFSDGEVQDYVMFEYYRRGFGKVEDLLAVLGLEDDRTEKIKIAESWFLSQNILSEDLSKFFLLSSKSYGLSLTSSEEQGLIKAWFTGLELAEEKEYEAITVFSANEDKIRHYVEGECLSRGFGDVKNIGAWWRKNQSRENIGTVASWFKNKKTQDNDMLRFLSHVMIQECIDSGDVYYDFPNYTFILVRHCFQEVDAKELDLIKDVFGKNQSFDQLQRVVDKKYYALKTFDDLVLRLNSIGDREEKMQMATW